jgi:hypothetical protein
LVLKCIGMALVNWNGGSALIFGTISYLAKHFFDGNHFLLHLYAVSFSSSYSLYIFYKILKNYFNAFLARKYIIFFGFLSYSFYYSGFMLRDVFIALLYMIAIDIYHEEKLRISTLIKFFVVALLTYSLRNESGLYIAIFIMYYVLKSELTSGKIILLIFAIGFMFSAAGVLSRIYGDTREAIDIYTEYTNNRTNNLGEGSLVKKIEKFPPVVKELSLISFNLMNPFPFWSVLKGRIGDFIFLNLSFAGMFSYYMNSFILLSLLFFRKKIAIKKSLKYLIFIAYLLFALNIVQLDTRRMFYVYPIIYIFFLILQSQIKKKKGINQIIVFFYFFISIVYIFVKY